MNAGASWTYTDSTATHSSEAVMQYSEKRSAGRWASRRLVGTRPPPSADGGAACALGSDAYTSL